MRYALRVLVPMVLFVEADTAEAAEQRLLTEKDLAPLDPDGNRVEILAEDIASIQEAQARCFHITRTRLVTERFRITADSEEEAYDLLTSADPDDPDVEKVEESTAHSETEITKVEAL